MVPHKQPSSPPPAKITPSAPPPATLARERLFQRLAGGLERSVTWLSAPPGSGKTTLVAHYLATRHLPCLWYRFDAADADVRHYLHYLDRAARRGRPGSRTAPGADTIDEGIDHASAIAGHGDFLASECSAPCVWVFDDFQELPAACETWRLLIETLLHLPSRVSVVIMSRGEPPGVMARLAVDQSLTVIEGPELALTLEETADLARSHGLALTDAQIVDIHRDTSGWAAGLVLLLEEHRRPTPAIPTERRLNPRMLFEYFTAEIFDRMDDVVQSTLLRTAFLTTTTPAMAEALAGPKAPRVLQDLLRRNYFIFAHHGQTLSYEYHALFRGFLRQRARRTLSPEALDHLWIQSAELLVCHGCIEEAAVLFENARAWPQLARLCETEAPNLWREGRAATAGAWIRALPVALVNESPWLLYWQARGEPVGVAARALFARAFAQFSEMKEVTGQWLAWIGIADGYYLLWDEYVSCDAWLSTFTRLVGEHPDFPSTAIEHRAVSRYVALLTFRRPHDPEIERWVGRLETLIDGASHPGARIDMAGPLIGYYLWTGHLAKAGCRLEALRGDSQLAHTPTSERLLFMLLDSAYAWHSGDFAGALATARHGLWTAAATGVHIMDQRLLAQCFYAHLCLGEMDGAAEVYDQSSTSFDGGRRLNASHHHYQAGWLRLRQATLAPAAAHGQAALMAANRAGAVFPRALCHAFVGAVRIAEESYTDALAHLNASAQIGEHMRSPILSYGALLLKAECLCRLGDERAAGATLRSALSLGRRHGYTSVWMAGWAPDMMARLCALALDYDIEPEQAQTLITRLALRPPDSLATTDVWPWPIKIYTLGTFRVEIDGQTLSPSGKSPHKLLLFVKALIALGGRGVPEAHLTDTLWPEADGDVGHQSFATTLHRVRRLVARPDALSLDHGLVSLNPACVWVDAWALQSLPDETPLSRLVSVLALYRGEFLAGDMATWCTGPRERLRTRFRRLGLDLGRRLEAAGEWERAGAWYERAIDIEPLAEPFYARLIRAHQHLGALAAAVGVYQRAEKHLQAGLGVTPSAELKGLFQALLKEGV